MELFWFVEINFNTEKYFWEVMMMNILPSGFNNSKNLDANVVLLTWYTGNGYGREKKNNTIANLKEKISIGKQSFVVNEWALLLLCHTLYNIPTMNDKLKYILCTQYDSVHQCGKMNFTFKQTQKYEAAMYGKVRNIMMLCFRIRINEKVKAIYWSSFSWSRALVIYKHQSKMWRTMERLRESVKKKIKKPIFVCINWIISPYNHHWCHQKNRSMSSK